MSFCCRLIFMMVWVSAALGSGGIYAQTSAQSSSNSAKPRAKPAIPSKAGESEIDRGSVANGLYGNKALGLAYKIPAGWVLRTDELNARDDDGGTGNQGSSASPSQDSRSGCPHACSRVLLAAFSRPPEARGEDINSSILIAAESVATYPGLTEAAQYFGPLTEVAKAQGFAADEEPYEIALGTKTLVRGDFHKDVGTRVMRQSTLAFLSHGYAVSITVIAGTEDEVEELIDGVSFGAGGK
jgi:hypothetical protein